MDHVLNPVAKRFTWNNVVFVFVFAELSSKTTPMTAFNFELLKRREDQFSFLASTNRQVELA